MFRIYPASDALNRRLYTKNGTYVIFVVSSSLTDISNNEG